jgi:hypothetical protein
VTFIVDEAQRKFFSTNLSLSGRRTDFMDMIRLGFHRQVQTFQSFSLSPLVHDTPSNIFHSYVYFFDQAPNCGTLGYW